MIAVQTKLTGDLAGALDKWGAQINEKVLFAGSAAMALTIYEAARAACPTSEKEHWFHGSMFKVTGIKYLFKPGTLKASIYRVYSKNRSSEKRKTYQISWNHKKCPYGFMVQYGTSKAAAHPFMTTAWGQIGNAIGAGRQRMAARLLELTPMPDIPAGTPSFWGSRSRGPA